jgi:hypothetical protein
MTMPHRDPQADARSDRRTMIVGVSVMLGLVVFGLAFGARFGATECRRLEPTVIAAEPAGSATAPRAGAGATALVRDAIGEAALAELVLQHGPLELARALPIDDLRHVMRDPSGVLLTGAGALLVGPDGDVLSGARFGEGVEVVGDGAAVFAVVVGNVITGQVDALRPLRLSREGVVPSACVDTSAVGSPLSFLHDAREGLLVGLRTDEDGSESVLELRDASRGRVWAPEVLLGRAPAGLHGARTSGRIVGDVVVIARRLSDADADRVSGAVLAFDRIGGEARWDVGAAELRAALQPVAGGALSSAATLRVEVVDADDAQLRLLVTPDVAADALLPPPLYGPFAGLVGLQERADREAAVAAAPAATVLLDLASGALRSVTAGAPVIEPDGLVRVGERVWLLVRTDDGADLLLRFGG